MKKYTLVVSLPNIIEVEADNADDAFEVANSIISAEYGSVFAEDAYYEIIEYGGE
jgi:hypothetical protein